nr:hypothetical protein [Tanacetum cinerariifolium]
ILQKTSSRTAKPIPDSVGYNLPSEYPLPSDPKVPFLVF